jgi:hypothetical protein
MGVVIANVVFVLAGQRPRQMLLKMINQKQGFDWPRKRNMWW